MNLNAIKTTLSGDDIPASAINPIIEAIALDELDQLNDLEKETLREVLTNILLVSQDPSTGAYVANPGKAEVIVGSLS